MNIQGTKLIKRFLEAFKNDEWFLVKKEELKEWAEDLLEEHIIKKSHQKNDKKSGPKR